MSKSKSLHRVADKEEYECQLTYYKSTPNDFNYERLGYNLKTSNTDSGITETIKAVDMDIDNLPPGGDKTNVDSVISKSSRSSSERNDMNTTETRSSTFTNEAFIHNDENHVTIKNGPTFRRDSVNSRRSSGSNYERTDMEGKMQQLDGITVIVTDNGISAAAVNNVTKAELISDSTSNNASHTTGSSSSANFIQNLACFRSLKFGIEALSNFLTKHKTIIKNFVYALIVCGYFTYFSYALSYEFGDEQSIRLLWCTLAVVAMIVIWYLKKHCGDWIYDHVLLPPVGFVEKHWLPCKILFISVVAILFLLFLILAVAVPHPENLISLSGIAIYVLLVFIFSSSRTKVKWQTVIWGLGLQFVFALLVLRTVAGYEAFKWVGDRIQEFLSYSDAGAIFIFGEDYEDHYFAMKVLPVVIYFSSVISVLYYVGLMQAVILKIAWIMQRTMSTTAAESVNAAGNIFIGQTEAPLLIRPFLLKMTKSEIHAVMVGGYATIAGSVMATYIILGVPANHLISASIMAAPCALALSKLSYPETEQSETTAENIESLSISTENNVVEAAANGASTAIALVANIAANLIAFIALLAFVNATLTWFGHRAGIYNPDLTFELICSYVLWPFAFIMGVATNDCRKVAELIGVKTFINEFVAFTELGKIIDNSNLFYKYVNEYGEDSWTKQGEDIFLPETNTTLHGGVMEEKSITISTYALCGFANISSIGCVIGGLSAIAPQRQKDIAALAVRAMVIGNIVSLLNACTAGLLYEPSDPTASNSTALLWKSMSI